MPPETTLVTGAEGFLGRLLVRRLRDAGRRVVALDRRRTSDARDIVEGDVRDRALIERLFTSHAIDAVVHLGGVSGQMLLRDDPGQIAEINVVATARLIETAWRAGVSRFVFASSLRAYGEMGPDPVPETAPFRPLEVYGASKAAGDALLRGYRFEHGLDGVSLRIGAVYGPERRTESLVARLLEDALQGRPTRLARNSGRVAPYVYRDDVVTALQRALDASAAPAFAYNIGGPDALSDAQVAEIIRDLVPEADITIPPPTGPLTGGPLDGSLAAHDLGFVPAFDMRRGIAAYRDWMRQQ